MDGHDRSAERYVGQGATIRSEEKNGGASGVSEGRAWNRDQAGDLGGKVLTYNPDLQSDEDLRNDREPWSSEGRQRSEQGGEERIREIAETGEGFGGATLERNVKRTGSGEIVKLRSEADLPGAETSVQSAEWLAEDREDIANERGRNGLYVKNLMDRNRKRITAETVTKVDKIIAENEYRPWQLDQVMMRARKDFLKDVFNRILGGRN